MPDRPLTAVLPTHQRVAALRVTFPAVLAMEGVDEVLVVVDGSTDGTVEHLRTYDDPRLRVLVSPQRRGVTAARNTGARAAAGDVVFLEDDCLFPPDYAVVLTGEAERYGAAVVGAPMVHPRPGEPVESAVAAARARAEGDGGLDGVARFPAAPVVTPLLQAPVLVRREVLDELSYDGGYVGNAYREETDFFLRATAAGYRCLLTDRTYFWEAGRFPGGQPRHPLLAEWWTWRNNWRFLRRHAGWLAEHGHLTTPAREQLAFTGRRLRGHVWPALRQAVGARG